MVDPSSETFAISLLLLFGGLAVTVVLVAAAAPAIQAIAPSLSPQPAHPRDPAPHIDRINDLTAAGRVSWVGLMAYLIFAFITVLGVEDADFFIPSRQTQLPLVNVAIPTEAFFYFAPILGVALYVYLHLYVRKATGALTAAPAEVDGTPLERHLKPWLLNDYVLRRRRDGAVEKRPLDTLASLVVIALVWCAGPFVLFGMWVRSWPAHDQYITTLAGACFALSLYAGHTSWVQMRRDLRRRDGPVAQNDRPRAALTLLLSAGIAWLGWVKTESGEPWDNPPEQTVGMTHSLSVFVATLPNVLDPDWWGALTPARLAEVQFAALPPDQADLAAARHRYRAEWCLRNDLDARVCGGGTVTGAAAEDARDRARAEWCTERGYPEGTCDSRFGELNQAFDREWSAYRTALIAALDKPDLRNADLRGADLSNASLTGVVLREARMEGANLSGARMEGADLREARMEGADLRGARMEGADLRGARMEGAILFRAQMEGADLRWARMEGANLWEARMEGADLAEARMEGADLRWARMDANTSFMAAVLRSAAMKDVTLPPRLLSTDQIATMFGDGSVILPDGMSRPAHWPEADLDWSDFEAEWRRWQDDPEGYVPPERQGDGE